MADLLTPYAGLTKPTVGADNDTWGGLLNGDLDLIDQFLRNIVPPGVSWAYRGAGAAPTGFLLEDGSAVSRATYAALYNVIGITYGAGDGVSTFNLPDSRNRFTVGAGLTFAVGQTGGAFTYNGGTDGHALTAAEGPSHNHGVNDPGHPHTLNDPGHYHYLNDPGHYHGISDPGHSHAVGEGQPFVFYKPGGAFSQAGANFGSASGTQADANNTGITQTQPVLTGVGVQVGTTQMTLSGAYTGITTQAAGGGAAHAHTLSNYAVTPPYLAASRIIKT